MVVPFLLFFQVVDGVVGGHLQLSGKNQGIKHRDTLGQMLPDAGRTLAPVEVLK